MKMFRTILASVVIMASTMLYGNAELSLSPVFTDNMVIQQNTLAPIWGYAEPNSRVDAVGSWDTGSSVFTISDGKGAWIMSMKTPKAGGPFTITVTSGETVTLNNVMAGEVWLCSGQSNMEWSANHGIKDSETEIAAANYPDIRIFQVPMVKAETPQYSVEGEWAVCTPEIMRKASAIGYFFARNLNRELNVPVGIISTAWGGSLIESWIPVHELPIDKRVEDRIFKNDWALPHGGMYNQMIYPFMPMKIAGVLWYQGESNHPNADIYGNLLKTMIRRWRDGFQTEFPFYMVQIAPFNYNSGGDGPAIVREQQEIVAKTFPRTGVVVVSDLVDNVGDIHPIDKQNVGLRLVNMALAEKYNKPIKGYKSPTFKSVKIKDNKAIIEFADDLGALEYKGASIDGLMIAGEVGVFVPAHGEITDSNKLVVWSDQVTKPTAVRYCFDDNTIGNIFSKNGMPVAPFRSDRKLLTE